MYLSKEAIKELKKNKSPEVILEFMPNPTFEEEFLEFVEEVLNWAEEKSTNKNNKDEC
jgi:hypothetical protein